MPRVIAVVLVLAILFGSSASSVRALNSEDLVYRPIETDRDGNIIPWYSPNLGEAYDHNVRLVWDFWKNMRTCDNGVKSTCNTRSGERTSMIRGVSVATN